MQVLLLSATLHSQEIKDLAAKITKFPTWVDLKGKEIVPENVIHAVVHANPAESNEWQVPAFKIVTDEIHAKDKLASDPAAQVCMHTHTHTHGCTAHFCAGIAGDQVAEAAAAEEAYRCAQDGPGAYLCPYEARCG